MSEKETKPNERLLPSAVVSLIMKKALPAEDHKVAQRAKEYVQECVSEFIGFVTCEAADRLTLDNRKTISGDDILDSMRALGFERYVEPLADCLREFRRVNPPRRKKDPNTRKKKVKRD